MTYQIIKKNMVDKNEYVSRGEDVNDIKCRETLHGYTCYSPCHRPLPQASVQGHWLLSILMYSEQ